MYLYIETFSIRSAVSVSVMIMPFGDTVRVTFRNFLALALACGCDREHNTHKDQNGKPWLRLHKELLCQIDWNQKWSKLENKHWKNTKLRWFTSEQRRATCCAPETCSGIYKRRQNGGRNGAMCSPEWALQVGLAATDSPCCSAPSGLSAKSVVVLSL